MNLTQEILSAYYTPVSKVRTAEQQIVVENVTLSRRGKTSKKNADCMKKRKNMPFKLRYL